MMRKQLGITTVLLYLSLSVCFAEETSPKRIVVKPFLDSFTQARVDFRRDTVTYKQEKVIFGLSFNLNDNWSARVGVDLIQMNRLYLKPTVLTFQKDRWTVDGGIFFTSELNMNLSQFWGNRFIDRVAADKWMYSPTADMGVRAAYRWNDFITTDVSLVSGNGYQRLLEKYHPKPAFRAILTPFRSLQLGGYLAVRKGDTNETTFNFFAHLKGENRWKITGEYHHQANSRFAEGRRLDVTSVHGAYNLLPWLSVMGRYDFVTSNRVESSGERWNVRDDGHMIITGFIFKCFPSMRVSVNYWNKRPSTKRFDKEDLMYICLEFRY